MASACATYLGIAGASALLPDPVVCNRELLRIGTYRRMADSTLRYDYSGSGLRWQLGWQLLDGTNKATLQAEAERTASMLFSPPTAGTCWNVLVMNYAEEAVPMAGGTVRWNATLTVETVDD